MLRSLFHLELTTKFIDTSSSRRRKTTPFSTKVKSKTVFVFRSWTLGHWELRKQRGHLCEKLAPPVQNLDSSSFLSTEKEILCN